jgi:hypothetical protein
MTRVIALGSEVRDGDYVILREHRAIVRVLRVIAIREANPYDSVVRLVGEIRWFDFEGLTDSYEWDQTIKKNHPYKVIRF